MPITDYDELSLEGVNIDQTVRRFSVLKVSFGDGYESGALVGAANGLHRWTLSAGAWPDSATYGQINGKTWMEYYWSFFQSHVSAGNTPFLIEWRGRKYFASFDNVEQTVEVFTSNLFAGNLTITQRRVAGYYEGTDGSVFDPSFLTTGIWAWHKAEQQETVLSDGDPIDGDWPDISGNGNALNTGTTQTYETNEQNSLPIVRFNGTNSWFSYGTTSPTIYEAYFVLKCPDATWANFSGILTADTTTAALVGNNGDTKLVNFSFGPTYYEYRKNGTLLTEATQNTPMQTFGVIHGRWLMGLSLPNPQIGKDRDIAARFAHVDIGEIILCDALQTDEVSADIDGYLKYRWGIA